MNSKLVYCKKQSDYTSHSFSDNQVIFIEETGEIITHGKSFGKVSGGNIGSTKTMQINGSSYDIATTSENLPTIYAPTVLGTAGYVLKTNTKGDGFVWEAEKTYSNFKGATETLNGTSGLVPQPKIDQRNYYLKGNGNWVKPSLSDFTDDVVSGSYLPLSGGTLKGEGDSVLTINRTDGWPLIKFSSNANIYGYLGVNNSKELVFLQYNQSEFYKILNSNNYSSYALPLSGGTLTNEGTGLFINRTKENLNPHICFKSQGTNVGDLGISYDGKPVFYDYTTGKTGWKVILHEGNYNSYALPLTGGTITGTLSIKRDSSVIRYYDSVGTLQGWLGFNGVNNPVIFEQDGVTTRKLLHAGNYSSYALPLSGGTVGELYVGGASVGTGHLSTQSSKARLALISFTDGNNYIESGNSDFSANAPLRITGKNAGLGSDLYLFFNNIYCRGNNYINIDSGNYSSYALPLSGGELSNSATGLFINRTTAGTNPHITFKSQGNAVGDIGISFDGTKPIWYNYKTKTWNDIITSSDYTASDVLSKLKGVDGANSGLDADLIDGYHISVTSSPGTNATTIYFII